MKIYFSYPNQVTLDQFLSNMQQTPFSYEEIGSTRIDKHSGITKAQTPKINETLKGYTIDYNHAYIGEGEKVWEQAILALKHWKHFPPSFTKIYCTATSIKKGTIVAVMIKILGVWWRNSAKIVYVIDEPNRFGFAYGTLLEHAEQGEEAFWIEKDFDGKISYHLRAFSKPKFWAARLAYPLTRHYQRKFAMESLQTMKDICRI